MLESPIILDQSQVSGDKQIKLPFSLLQSIAASITALSVRNCLISHCISNGKELLSRWPSVRLSLIISRKMQYALSVPKTDAGNKQYNFQCLCALYKNRFVQKK